MEITLTVPAEFIAVLKLFAAEKDVREYLNGIGVEIGATESRLVASNGEMLGCFRVMSEQPEVTAPLTNIVIPNDLLKQIKPKGTVEITLGPLEAKTAGNGEEVPVSHSRPVSIAHAGVTLSGMTIDSEAPNYRGVIPLRVSGQPGQFNPRLTGALAKAWAILHGGKSTPCVGIGFNGEDPALIDLNNDNFIGIFMPLRPKVVNAPVSAPPWCFDRLHGATDSVQDLV